MCNQDKSNIPHVWVSEELWESCGFSIADCQSHFQSSIISAWGHFVESPPEAYKAPNNFITTYIKAKLWSCSHLWETWKPSVSHCAAPPLSPHSFDLQSLAASVPFFLSSLFPCLSSLNLSSSCCSIASPVLCSAVLITVPFSCQETEYDEDMWRGREHLLTRSEPCYIKYMESLRMKLRSTYSELLQISFSVCIGESLSFAVQSAADMWF